MAVAHRVRSARSLSIFRETHPAPQPNSIGVYSPSAWMKDVGDRVTESLVQGMRDNERRTHLKAARRIRLEYRPLRLKAVANKRKRRELPAKIKIAEKRLYMQIRIGERQRDIWDRHNEGFPFGD